MIKSKSTRSEAKKATFSRPCDTPESMNPMTLPWNQQPTAPGEWETWEELRWDLMEAFDEGHLTREEAYWYVTIMADMFESKTMRTPTHVVLARMVFFTEPLEA